jgi:hypothetical protein
MRDCCRADSRHSPRGVAIDIEACPASGGAVQIIACIEDPGVVERILAHLEAQATELEGCRAPLQAGSFD